MKYNKMALNILYKLQKFMGVWDAKFSVSKFNELLVKWISTIYK